MLLRSLVAGPLGPGGLAATALRASPALAQLLSGAMEAWKGAGSGQHAAAGLQRWGALTALAPPPPPPAAAGQRRGFAASTAWQQSRPTAVTQAATAAERGRGSGRDGKLSNALDGTAALSVDWPEENDASDCSMCTAGALDDEARAAVAAAEEAEAAAGTAVAGADELAWRRGRTPPQRLPVMQEQVFKADAHYVGSKIDIYALKVRAAWPGLHAWVAPGRPGWGPPFGPAASSAPRSRPPTGAGRGDAPAAHIRANLCCCIAVGCMRACRFLHACMQVCMDH